MRESVLVTGPAGSGKTAHCLRVCSEALKESGPGQIIYLVPSAEAIRDTERQLLLTGLCDGIFGPLVMDFTKLALRILKEGGCFPFHQISLLEREFLILKIIGETPLRFFQNVEDYEGFAHVVADFIAELKRGMISPENFSEGCLAVARRQDIARDKLRELHAIYLAYQDALKKRGDYDRDGLQWKAAEVLSADRSLLSLLDVLLIDGFATYTPVEFEILTQLVARVPKSHITLCYEEARPDVFAFVERTYAMLRKLCTGREIALTGNHRASGSLLHLERELFSEQESRISAGISISIVPCSDAYREVETVAREIETIRREEELEYSNFMVILRDVGDCSRAIAEVFREKRIPYFLPSPGQIAEEPFIRQILSALQLVKGEFRREDVLAVLKSSYLNADSDLGPAIENYADEFGLWEEEHFRQTWTQPGREMRDAAPLNEYKTRFLDVLDRLRSEAKGISSAQGFRRFIFRAIGEFGFLAHGEQSKRDSGWQWSKWEDTYPSLSAEYRCLKALAGLLDAMCEYAGLIGLSRADYGDFLEMLERGLVWTSLPSPPRDMNGVRVTSIVGGPPPEAAVVFICGLCERSFPREIANEPFFNDRERRLINRQGKIFLDERLPLSCGERFFFYIAVSRATRRLVLTYPAMDKAGKELVHSHYVEEVARVFSDLGDMTEEKAPVVNISPEFALLTDARELRSFVAYHLSRATSEGVEDSDENSILAALAYNKLIRLGDFGADDLIYETADEKLSEEVCRDLREKDAYLTSVSELETFARCPFRHFCQYRLRLKELPRYTFGPVEEGTLYHEVLARFYREIYAPSCEGSPHRADAFSCQCNEIEDLSPDELDSAITLLVEEFIGKGYSRLFLPPRMEVRRRALLAKIKDFLLKEVENERTNATRPAYFELSFGKGKGHESADSHSTEASLCIRGEKATLVRISGRIDRVDTFEKDDESFGVVLDYKRSAHVSRADLRRGTVLQPGIYLLALRELFGLRAAGAFYYSISSGRKRGIFATEEEERISGEGDVSRVDRALYDEIHELMELNARQAVEYVQRIMEGEISIRPADRNECRYCPFSSVCRISEQGFSS